MCVIRVNIGDEIGFLSVVQWHCEIVVADSATHVQTNTRHSVQFITGPGIHH